MIKPSTIAHARVGDGSSMHAEGLHRHAGARARKLGDKFRRIALDGESEHRHDGESEDELGRHFGQRFM